MQHIEVKPTDTPAARLQFVASPGVEIFPILETDDLCWVKVKMQGGARFQFDASEAVKLLYRVSGQGTVRTTGRAVPMRSQERLVIPEGQHTELQADADAPTEDILLLGMNQIAGALFNTFRGSGD